MASIREVEHAPEASLGVWLRDLEEREIGGVWRGEGELVDRSHDTGIGDGPFQVPRSLATNDSRAVRGAMSWIRRGTFSVCLASWREELRDAEVPLR